MYDSKLISFLSESLFPYVKQRLKAFGEQIILVLGCLSSITCQSLDFTHECYDYPKTSIGHIALLSYR